MLKYALVVFCTLVLHVNLTGGLTCNKNVLGLKVSFSCPLPGDPEQNVFCCGSLDNRRCCNIYDDVLRDFSDDPWDDDKDFSKMFRVIGGIVGAILGAILLTCLCCCFLPCCFLAKRRRRGLTHGPVVIGGAREAQPMTTTYAPQQGYPTAQPYPTQGGVHYPPPSGDYYPPPSGVQPGYGPPPGYPAQPPPYPGPPAGGLQDNYQTKQPAFNPNSAM